MSKKTLSVQQVIRIIKKLDAAEADIMGVSCQMFAGALEEKLRETEKPPGGRRA